MKQSDIYIYLFLTLSHVKLFATPWTVAHQAPLSMGFSRQEYWSGLPFLSSGDLPDPGIDRSPALQADSLLPEPPGKPYIYNIVSVSAIQQSEAVIYIYIYIYLYLFRYFSYVCHYRVLSTLCYTVDPY